MKDEKVDGQVGFDNINSKPKMISKEETMFKVDENGKAIADVVEIVLYDRELDKELLEESLLLMDNMKKQKAINSVIKQAMGQHNNKIKELEKKYESEKNEEEKKKFKQDMDSMRKVLDLEDIKTNFNSEIINGSIKESKEIIKELKEEIEKQKTIALVKLQPCNVSEAYLAFEQGEKVDGGETDDWVSDLIVEKCKDPSYTLDEAKRLKPDYIIALKEAIMEASGYKTKSYRDLISEKKLEMDKPLTLKKKDLKDDSLKKEELE